MDAHTHTYLSLQSKDSVLPGPMDFQSSLYLVNANSQMAHDTTSVFGINVLEKLFCYTQFSWRCIHMSSV